MEVAVAYRTKGALSVIARRVLNNTNLNSNSVEIVRGRYGFISFFSSDQVIGRSLQLYGEWAENEIAFLRHFIRPADSVLDVGANIGTHTLAFAQAVGPKGQVYAFEPRPEIFRLLEAAIRDNALTNVTLRQAAVGAIESVLHVPAIPTEDSVNFGGLSLVEAIAHAGESIQKVDAGNVYAVPMTTIDSLGLTTCRLIKIDVEGAELDVLEGARSTINRLHPVLYAECNSVEVGIAVKHFYDSVGYRTFMHLSDAFNANNFFLNTKNIFGNAREAALLGIHPSELGNADVDWAGNLLLPIDNADAITFGLLQKPQFFREALEPSSAGQRYREVTGRLGDPQDRFDTSEKLVMERISKLEAEIRILETQAEENLALRLTIEELKGSLGTSEKLAMENISKLEAEIRILETQAEENLALRLTIEELKGSLGEKERILEDILHSRSWRLSAPLRQTAQQVRILRAVVQRALAKRGYLNSHVLRRSAVYLFTGRWRTLIQKARRHWLDDKVDSPTRHTSLTDALSWLLPYPKVEPRCTVPADIIIPVYNGMEFLEDFFDRLISGTPAPYRLIIVDDASPDPRVYPFLESIVQRLPADTVILLRNAKNLGFVGTVNRALGVSQHDVVLLNTDVLLPPDWLGRLLAPIDEDAKVASVTPFTNAGTICSFPQCCVDNSPFMALDVAEIDRAFRRLDPTFHTIDLPTGVGFCMALSRRAINEVGVLDEKTFGKGYGEENDWCMRATRRGYRHRIAPNLYVHHSHGGSFAPEEKKALIDRNLRLLEARYPEYSALVGRFIHEDPLQPIRQVMAVLLAAEHAAKTMLIIDHGRGGGANHYRDLLVDQWLREHALVLLFVEDYLNLKRTLTCCYGDDRWSFFVPDLSTIKDLSEKIDITEIWYNSTVFSADPMASVQMVTELKKNSSATLIITIHDYFPLCPSYTLIDHQERFCGLPDPAICRRCLPHNRLVFPNSIDDIDRWRDVWGKCLSLSDSILCFSESSKLLVERIYPLVADRILVRPHSMDYFASRKKPRWDLQNGIHIGVIGALSFQKGAGVIQNIARLIKKEDLDLSLTVIGYVDESFPLPDHVPITGPYDSQDLAGIIEQNKINFILFPSIWPETFSYVTSEVIAMDLPIACFDYGAQAEKVSSYELGLVLTSSEAEMIIDEIRQFCGELRNKKATSFR